MGFWNVLFGILNIENLFPLSGVDTGQTGFCQCICQTENGSSVDLCIAGKFCKTVLKMLKRAIGFLLCMLLLCGGLF